MPGPIDTTKIKTQLTDLQVNEVSFVHKGAIGEQFTIMKSEDAPQDGVENLEKGDSSNMVSMIQNMPDTEFVSLMRQMMDRYHQINKNEGGIDMDENQVKELVTSIVTEVIGKSMETVNSNFVKVNKSIDEITKKITEEPKKPAEEPKKTEEPTADDEVKKAVNALGDAVKSIADTVSGITKSLEGLGTISETVKKMADETLPGISTRVEAIEKQEQKPNGVDGGDENKEDVKKSASSKWPSFTRPVED